MKHFLTYLIGLALIVILPSCAGELIDNPRGDLDEIRDSFGGTESVGFRCLDGDGQVRTLTMTAGSSETMELGFQAFSTLPVESSMSLDLREEKSLVKKYSEETGIEYSSLPQYFTNLSGIARFDIEKGESESGVQSLKISPTTSKYGGHKLEPGRYLLPLIFNGNLEHPFYIDLTVRKKFENDYPLFEDEDKMFFVFYLNTGRFDPRLVTDFYLQETRQDWEAAIGNILNLRKSVVTPDEDNNPILVLYPDLKYVLENRDTYILPVQESGRKVCLCIEGGGKGLGFCNLTEDQIESLTDQIIRTLDRYHLQGVNLWDRGTNYGLEGMPEMNTTSYPQFIKRLREKLGSNRILTLVDFEEPTASFWDKAACGGIEVGQYIDYAWSGYNKEQDGVQVIDPYHQGMEGVSTQYPRKPILGLSPKKYGCVNVPWFGYHTGGPKDPYVGVRLWESNDFRFNSIFVYQDISSNIQGAYENSVDPGAYLKELFNARGMKPRILLQLIQFKGYGNWLKNW